MRLSEIRSRVEKATKGPWNALIRRVAFASSAFTLYPDYGVRDEKMNYVVKFGSDENLDFIAHSREDIPWLLERLSIAEKALESIQTRTGGFADDWAAGLNRTASEALSKLREENAPKGTL